VREYALALLSLTGQDEVLEEGAQSSVQGQTTKLKAREVLGADEKRKVVPDENKYKTNIMTRTRKVGKEISGSVYLLNSEPHYKRF